MDTLYRTAYEEALANSMTATEDTPSEDYLMPSYMVAADTHNIANRNKTFLESAVETVENIPKFVGLSLISGVNQIYNAPADIGNFFGGDFERSDTADIIAGLDSNISEYYQEHREGIDTLGFVAFSWIPGMGGIKALHAGQSALKASLVANKFGTNMSKALGLLVPEKQTYLAKAISEAVNGNSIVSLTEKNILSSMAAGLGQNVLEAAAFETAVAATMFNSPVLEGQDLGDFVSNIAWGAGVFGAVGGALDVTKSYFAVRRAVKAGTREAMPWKFVANAPEAAAPYEKIALDFEQLHAIPPIPSGGINIGTEGAKLEAATLAADAAAKAEKLELRIRKQVGKIAGGDQEIAEVLYQSTKNASLEQKLGNYIGMKDAARMTETTAIEKEMASLLKKTKSGKAEVTEAERLGNLSVTYTRMWGEGAGKTVSSPYKTTTLSDTLKTGESITVDSLGVKAGTRKFSFNPEYGVKNSKPWNIHTSDPLEAQARHIWASKLPKFPEITEARPVIINESDIPLMEKAFREYDPKIQIRTDSGEILPIDSQSDFLKRIQIKKEELAVELHNAPVEAPAIPRTQEDIASIVNVKSSYLDGEMNQEVSKDIFAMQDFAEEYTNRLKATGALKEDAPVVDVWNIPQTVKITYDATPFSKLKGHEIENMVQIKQQQKLYIDATDRITASILKEEYANFPKITDKMIQETANSLGAGAGFATAASSNYGTLAALTEYIGKTTIRIIEKFQTSTREALEPALYKVSQNQEAAIEWSTLNANLRAIPENYTLNEAGDAMVPLILKRWEQKSAEAIAAGTKPPARPTLKTPDAPELIPIKNPEVAELAKIHIERNGKRVEGYRDIRTSQGVEYKTDPEAFYAPPVDPKEYPFFALVYDDTITGTGHVKSLYDTTEEGLSAQIRKMQEIPGLKIRTKKDAEEYYNAIGQFDFEKTLNDNYIDIAAKRKGVSSPYFVPTDPQKIVADTLNWHLKKEAGFVRETVAAKYEVPFTELRKLGDSFTKIATSKFSGKSLVKYADDVIKNPYADYVKTALGIRKYSDHPFWVNANRMADEKLSTMYSKITTAFDKAKTPDDLKVINKILDESGYKGAAYDENMELFANNTANKGLLTSAIQKSNSILATVILRWDFLNAANNAISANVLLGAETKAVIRAIEGSDAEAIGELSKLAKISVPGTPHEILSGPKLVANSIKRFGTNTPEMQFYKDHGFISSISDQYRRTLDDLTFNGKESVSAWNSRIDGVHKTLREAANTGEKWTGNRLAEEFNRFVAADVMKQITDIAVKKELISPQEQLAYINTFVNRTQGNYLAAQRPMMFQGPVGQAIGLFQTYQFNLMQQLLRHVGEGHAKDAMTLLALQGTIHGANGLPAFNAINTHIVGNASGNTEHRDLYDTLYGTVGKQAGDWLMYGVASNFLLHPDLKVNLYTRGDINPRQVTIIPTDPASVPIVQASAKFFSNIFETAGKLAAGGDVATTILQGIEHNAISRPLAGLAQTLEGLANPLGQSYSTSGRGNVIASNDLFNLTNLGRIAGGKPLDEAIAQDAAFRFKAYGMIDFNRRDKLGEVIKTTLIAGQRPSTEQITKFAEEYAALGGKSDQFNSWFLQLYKTANLSQANKLSQDLNGKFSQSMQKIMGGYELRDFTK